LILLINLKLALSEKSPRQIFDEYRVWQNRRTMYSAYLNRFDIKSLFALLATLTDIEISLKHNNDLPIWDALLSLTMQFMGLNKC
jgi:DNA polymerase III, delta subunit